MLQFCFRTLAVILVSDIWEDVCQTGLVVKVWFGSGVLMWPDSHSTTEETVKRICFLETSVVAQSVKIELQSQGSPVPEPRHLGMIWCKEKFADKKIVSFTVSQWGWAIFHPLGPLVSCSSESHGVDPFSIHMSCALQESMGLIQFPSICHVLFRSPWGWSIFHPYVMCSSGGHGVDPESSGGGAPHLLWERWGQRTAADGVPCATPTHTAVSHRPNHGLPPGALHAHVRAKGLSKGTRRWFCCVDTDTSDNSLSVRLKIEECGVRLCHSSGAVRRSRWPSWTPCPEATVLMVSVDVKQD